MIRCRNCHANQMNGAIFCSECGESLLNVRPNRETTNSLNQQSNDVPMVVEDEPESVTPAPPLALNTISLVVINSGRRINLEAGEELLVGRKDNQRGIFPDVDLGLDGGYDAGVSRRHAIITPDHGIYLLEDLSSANGTFINGRRVEPQTPSPIQHGDELRFGTLILRFELN
ncbi:FHA domain-containing protein [Candidatus Oscillochloris fontis]|uniref:FHA domain-containing protein n=1 Tax=Candidatus Oscillochloris fontis TaxID=2496868 RepID=UPI001EE7F24D|nr:FHA domain-containing protein [Candidatus Oscillochloris fontis]